MGGLARKGYCASLKRWFCGVREHLIFTPEGLIAFMVQVPGHRHDVQGLYALIKTRFTGRLIGDNAYWPRPDKRVQLSECGISVMAASRSNWTFQYPPSVRHWHHKTRGRVERMIGLFNKQFHAHGTYCRSARHYCSRRWMKAFAHNCSRLINSMMGLPIESVYHFHLAA